MMVWIAPILGATALFYMNPWDNQALDYFLIIVVILGGPFLGTLLLFRWIDEKAAKNQLIYPDKLRQVTRRTSIQPMKPSGHSPDNEGQLIYHHKEHGQTKPIKISRALGFLATYCISKILHWD